MSVDTLNTKAEHTRTGPRGDRLFPDRSNRLYWLLNVLRDAYVDAIDEFVVGNTLPVLIDYGCGNMPYRTLFPVANYIGVDFPGNDLAQLTLNEAGEIPLDDSIASVVLSSQVLEHVADVDQYLAECHRVLTANGLLFLSTHGSWKYHPDPHDYWRWTCDGLKRVIEAGGFEIASFRGVLGPEATALQLWQDAVATRVPYRIRHWFYRYMQRRIQRADQRCSDAVRNRDACVFLVVARKCI